MAEINDELRVLVTAEVEKAIKNLKSVDKQTDTTEKMFKKLGSAIGAAFTVKTVVSFGRACTEQFRETKQVTDILKSTVEATGASAWTTFEELKEMAEGLQQKTNFAASSIESMQSVLLGFKNIKGETFEEATKAILDMATVMGMDLKSAAQSVGKALDDPIHGMDSLKKQGFNFSESQKKVIQSFLDTGDAASAQKIILDELGSTFGGAAEAAADGLTQIKNSFDDVLEAYGYEFTELFNAFNGSDGKNKIASGLKGFADSIKEGTKDWHRLLNFDDWYAKMSDTEKLEEASRQLEIWTEKYEKSINSRGLGAKKSADYAKQQMAAWENVVNEQKKVITTQKEIQQQQNDREAAEAKINDLMLEVSKNYDKLASDEPTVQLQKYLKKLEEIEKQRRDLSQSALDSDGNLIDTSEAMRQLDVLEKNIKKKIENLEIDGKKSWQNWLSEILGVDKKLFTTGKQAAELYLSGVETSIESAEGISKALGEKFSKSDFLESQLEEIKSKIQEALTVDPSKITESFSLDELSKESSALGELAKKYKELKEAKGEAAAAEEIKRLEKEVANLGKTERELYLIQLEENGATKEQIERAKELRETLDRYKDLDSFDSLSEKIGYMTEQWLISLDAVDEKTAKVIGNLTAALSQVGFDSVVSGAEEFGKALGKGEDGAEAMQKAMASMAKQILKQLPMLFVNAGLTLIAQGQWPIGLGFIFGGLADAVISGLVEGATENAKGGVYGDSGYSAFAKGGAFTNQIVTKPTYFKFAKGSGFGTGLMGEAGPEAIMPLTRGADGSLGVTASGLGGNNVEINIPVTVYSDEPVEVHDEEDDSGQRKIEILVGSMINNHISNGKADKALKNRFGLKAQGI